MAHKMRSNVDFSNITNAINEATTSIPVQITAAGAVDPHTPATYVFFNNAADAMTLAAPLSSPQTSGGDDGIVIRFTSSTAFAHTITATGILFTGSASVNVATFAAQKGASLELMAYGGKWLVQSANAVTYS